MKKIKVKINKTRFKKILKALNKIDKDHESGKISKKTHDIRSAKVVAGLLKK